MPSISVSQTENFHYLKFFLWLLSSLGKLQLWLNFVYGVIPFLPDRLKKKKPNLLGKYTLKLEGKAKDMFTEIRFSSGMGKASLRHTKKRKAAFDIWSSFVHKTSNFEKLFHCTTYRAL